jgi:phenylalanyl-tRNA synthetase alpha subunit
MLLTTTDARHRSRVLAQLAKHNLSNQEKLYLNMQANQDDLSFEDVSNYSWDVAARADEFKTLGQLNIEKEQQEAENKKTEKKQESKLNQKTTKVQQIQTEDERKYAKVKLYNEKQEQMNKLKQEMDELKRQIIADKRAELSKIDAKNEGADINQFTSQLSTFATRLASIAQQSSDLALAKMVGDSTLLQIDDESLANVEIDDGGSQAEQPLGAGALDDS